MSTTVLLRVTPKQPIDVDRFVAADVAADIAAALRAVDQPVRPGLTSRRSGPWRFEFQLSGPDRVQDGQRLQERLRSLGYETDVVFSP